MTIALPDDTKSEYEDVLGSGGIFKRTLRKTEGARAEYGEQVTIRYSEFLLDTDARIRDEVTREFRIGDGEVMPALELVAKMLRVGEVCEVRCEGRFAYGTQGLDTRVPPDAALRMVVELLHIARTSTLEMTSKELLQEATKKKESGNRYFQQQQYDRAAALYKKALKILEDWERERSEVDESEDEDAQQCRELLIALGNNVANVQHRLAQHKEATQSSKEVLQLDGNNVKALYRLAQIAMDQGEFASAIKNLKCLIMLEPGSAKFRDMLTKARARRAEAKERERKLYAKLGASNKTPQHAEGDSDSEDEDEDENAAAPPSDANALSPLRQFIRNNISIIATVCTMLIALIAMQFMNKQPLLPTE